MIKLWSQIHLRLTRAANKKLRTRKADHTFFCRELPGTALTWPSDPILLSGNAYTKEGDHLAQECKAQDILPDKEQACLAWGCGPGVIDSEGSESALRSGPGFREHRASSLL